MVELNLTKRQQEIFDYIKRYSGEHGYPPTVRDIGKAIGLTSSSTVHALSTSDRTTQSARRICLALRHERPPRRPSRGTPGGATAGRLPR